MVHDSPSSRTVVESSDSHKIAQAVYHAVTSKTEKLTKTFSDNYCVKFADLEQLHAKCSQMCSQWTVMGSSENITVHHVDDNNQNFSSIERLKEYDQSQTCAVEGITFEFKLLLALSSTPKAQPYNITARIMSPLAMMSRINRDLPPPRFLRFFRGGAIVVEVEYVDYVVARNIMSTLESWVNEIQISSRSEVLRFAQRFSHWIPRISGAMLLLISAITAIQLTDQSLESNSGDAILAKFLIGTFAFIAASMYMGTWLGRFTEGAIDRLQELSYIDFNRGDARLLDSYKKRNIISIIGAMVSFALISAQAIACGIVGTYIYEKFL